MSIPQITSASNPKVRAVIALKDRRERDRRRRFVVEGARNLGRALEAGHQPVEGLYDPERFDPPGGGVTWVPCTREVLSRASYRSNDEGVIAVFSQFDLELARLTPRSHPLVLMVEGVGKPGNLGAMLRIADAVGADCLLVVDPTIDVFNPNVVRSSTGALFTVPIAVAGLGESARWLESHRIPLVAAAPVGGRHLWDVSLEPPCALLVGAEDAGLSDEALELADTVVTIPMRGAVDSLNASVSLAVLAYEARRP